MKRKRSLVLFSGEPGFPRSEECWPPSDLPVSMNAVGPRMFCLPRLPLPTSATHGIPHPVPGAPYSHQNMVVYIVRSDRCIFFTFLESPGCRRARVFLNSAAGGRHSKYFLNSDDPRYARAKATAKALESHPRECNSAVPANSHLSQALILHPPLFRESLCLQEDTSPALSGS